MIHCVPGQLFGSFLSVLQVIRLPAWVFPSILLREPLLCRCQHMIAVECLSEAVPGCDLPLDGGRFFDEM